MNKDDFEQELCALINKHGVDSFAGMPDFLVTAYLSSSVLRLRSLNKEMEKWSGNPGFFVFDDSEKATLEKTP